MIVYAPAKINIGLKVLNKREDSYHNLDSVFYPIPLYDIIEIQRDRKFILTITGLQVDGDPMDNLIYKAWYLLMKKYNIDGVNVHLHKRIPMGAGLGGGSSDASHVLKSINELYELNIDSSTLKYYAAQLGSDCPFFIDNVPVRARGVGDELEKIDLDLSGLFLLIVKPDVHISTQDAYANIKVEGENSVLYREYIPEMGKWRSLFNNSFEDHIFERFPILESIKKQMYDGGAIYASMSGSGSSIYGLYKSKPFIPNQWSNYFTWLKKLP